jgi:hypothetical protein
MRDAIVTLAAVATLAVFETECRAGEQVPTELHNLCSSEARFYEDAIFSFQMQHQGALDAAIGARQAVPAFDVDRSIDATLAQTPARGLPKTWRAKVVRAVYTQPQFVVWSPDQASRLAYGECLDANLKARRSRPH